MFGPRKPLGGQYVGAGGALVTPEQVAQQKQIAAALLEQAGDTSPVGHWSAALNRGLQGWLGGRDMYRARQAESEGTSKALDRFNARNSGSGAASRVAEALAGGATSVQPYTPPAEAAAIREGLIARGLPEHIADGFIMNFQDESGLNPGINERNPVVPGSRGGFGLYQLTGPRRVAYEQFAAERGVDPSDVDAQLDFLMYELQGPEAKAAQSIFSAQNAGEAGAAIVNQFLRPAAEHRTSRANRYLGAGAGISQAPAASNVSEIAALLADPWLPKDAKAVLQAEMNQQMQMQNAAYEMQLQQQDPMRQIQLQQERLKLEQMLNPDPKMSYVQMPNGEFVQVNESAGTLNSLGNFAKVEPGYTQLSADAANQLGLDPNRQWQVSPDNRIEPIGGTPLVQNYLGGEREWDKESAKLWAKRYDSMVGGASAARDMLGMYDLAESALNSGVRTGFGASQEQALRRMASGLGLGEDADKLAAGELLNTIQNRMALMMRNPDGGMGMPGAMSDADRNFLRESQIGLDRTPEGNRRMLQAFRAIEQRKIELANLADDYISDNGKMDEGFNKVVQKFADENPLFGGQEKPSITTRRRYNPQTRSFE